MTTATIRGALATLALFSCLANGTQAQELTWAEKMFDTLNHDFGVVARGADVRYRLKVTNLYKEDAHIVSVRTTCGCSAANPSKNTLASRESAFIEITMDTRKFIREKHSNVIVTFDAPLYAEVRIPIRAYIRTDVVLTPGAANFGPVDQGVEHQRKIEIAYAGRDDWTIKGVKSNSRHLTARVVETSRGGGRVNYNVLVTLKPTVPVGQFREQLILITDDPDKPNLPLLVDARVEADITVTPSLVSLGTLTPGQNKTVNVVLRGKKPFAIENIECESDRKAFTIRLPKQRRQVHVLPLTITTPNQPGKFTEEFTVTIAGRKEPITFKAYGQIVEAEED